MDPPSPSSPTPPKNEEPEGDTKPEVIPLEIPVESASGDATTIPNSEPAEGPKDKDSAEDSDKISPEDSDEDSAEDSDEYSDEDSDLLERFPSISLGELPMPDATEFSVPLPAELQGEMEDIPTSESVPEEAPRPLAPLPSVVHVSEILKPMDMGKAVLGMQGVQVAHIGLEAGLTGNMQATYLHLPPGTRTSRPVAQRLGDSITYCISGRGLLWQNGWTFPFEATDCAGWKGGSGISHTIINDSNRDGSAGEDLFLITAHELKEGETFFHPMDPDMQASHAESEGNTIWKEPPVQGEFGMHPGVPSMSPDGTLSTLPEPQLAFRPSNVINTIAELDSIGKGELFANATSLSQETGLSGRLGCNFEVPPPGTRSSDAHAHSLEDELVYIVGGSGLVWINGNVQPVREGDAVGFPGGTGVAHTFINDSNADGAEGEPLLLWIIGQNKSKEGDLVYYPLHVEQKSKSRRWWPDAPKYELGPHNGRPQRPHVIIPERSKV